MSVTESQTNLDLIAKTIRDRKTEKVLAKIESPVSFPSPVDQLDSLVRNAIHESSWAPFHYDRKIDSIAEPWRYHVVWHNECRTIAKNFFGWHPDAKPSNKLPAMLAACGALVLITWIPQKAEDESKAKTRQVNEEHLMAAAAATQNLLLLLTASGLGSYWSSGGQFRESQMFERLGIGENERLMAAVFVDYSCHQSMANQNDQALGILDRISGKNRERRSPAKLARGGKGVASG